MSDLMRATTIGGLVHAAADLDTDAVAAAVRRSIASNGVTRTWEWLVSPAWHAVRTGRDDADVAVRLFTQAVSQVLAAARRPLDRLPVTTLLAGTEREDHVLPLEAFAAALAEVGAGCCLLGALVPPPAVVAAVRRLHPAVVVIWSQTGDTADPRQLRTLAADCPTAEVITAGPGWDDAALPANTVSAAFRLTLVCLSSPAEADDRGEGRKIRQPNRRPHARQLRPS
jgi:hypothetical protein